MDFNNLELGDDLQTCNKQADMNAYIAEQNARMRKEMQQMFGQKLIIAAQAPIIAVNPVTQQEYDCRLYALLNIIKNPELSTERYPLASTWKKLYPHIPYNEKATNWKLSKKDRETLIAEMRVQGSYKYVELTRVRHFIERVHTHYLANQVIDLTKRIKVLELQQVDNGNIWYQGVEIVKLARTFKVIIGETSIETRHGTFDKLFEFLGQIDERLS